VHTAALMYPAVMHWLKMNSGFAAKRT